MNLATLLPGGRDLWFCTDASCKWNPVSGFTLGCFVLSQLTKMNQMCLNVGLGIATTILTLEQLHFEVPYTALKVVLVTVLALHIPVMNKKQSYGFLASLALTSFGLATDQMENVEVVFAATAFMMFAHRLFLSALTLRAHYPTPLVFPIVSHIMPRWSFSDEDFFRTDNAPEHIVQKRREAFAKLEAKWKTKFERSIKESSYLSDKFSDLRFSSGSRVFIPFQKRLETWCDPCTVIEKADRTDLIDVDGNRLTDVSGSYGVNVCGYDEYKRFIREGLELTKDVGCVLGPLHPLVRENIDMLREISGKEEVSFHMSGTEAVMCATRLARFNTKKKFVVLFGGAYHGWWDGVQPMAGNERFPVDVITLKDMSPASMSVIRWRAHEIAAVVINPLQAFHPNAPPPSDLVLANNLRGASDSTKEYKRWLEQMRETCTEYGVVLIFDEVYTGFRLAPGGAQEYFGVNADMVVYGKTLGGGLANGIVCGPRHLMCRFDPVKPLRVAYVVGTFAAQPLLVGSMNRFLKWVTSPATRDRYNRLRQDVQDWVESFNKRIEKEFPKSTAPLAVAAYSSIWTMLYKRPGRYHWMLQYYLKDEGVNLSWVGTGRVNFSLDYEREDLDKLTEKLVRACHRMEEDGWWWVQEGDSPSKVAIQIKLVTEIVKALVKRMFSFS